MPQVLKCQTPLFRMDLILFMGEGDTAIEQSAVDVADTVEKAASDAVDVAEVDVAEVEACDLEVVLVQQLPLPILRDTPNTTATMVQ